MPNLNFVHLEGAMGGELDRIMIKIIEVAPPEVVVVVDDIRLCEAEMFGTCRHPHALTETPDDLHLLEETEVGVPEKRTTPDPASATAVRVGAPEVALVLLVISV